MSIIVYGVSGAPRAWRVLLGLAFKGIEYDVKLLQASQKEHKSPEYLQINPRGTIPALTYKNITLRDSIAILAWLDREFPANPLFGETADDSAIIWQVTLEACDYLRAATNDLFSPLLFSGKVLPTKENDEWQVWVGLAEKLTAECQHLETLLENNLFLAGGKPSAADAVCFPEISLIERIIKTKPAEMEALGITPIFDELPKLAQWKKRVSELPNVDKTMPPHWSNS
jgi:glutathione S-transferase